MNDFHVEQDHDLDYVSTIPFVSSSDPSHVKFLVSTEWTSLSSTLELLNWERRPSNLLRNLLFPWPQAVRLKKLLRHLPTVLSPSITSFKGRSTSTSKGTGHKLPLCCWTRTQQQLGMHLSSRVQDHLDSSSRWDRTRRRPSDSSPSLTKLTRSRSIDSVLVNGPYLVRNASISKSTLLLVRGS